MKVDGLAGSNTFSKLDKMVRDKLMYSLDTFTSTKETLTALKINSGIIVEKNSLKVEIIYF